MTVVVWILLLLAVALILVSAVGVAVMDDPYQKLHFIAPPATLSSFAIALAVLLSKQTASGIKCIVIALVLTAMNGAVSHATARAARVREHGRVAPHPRENIPIV